MYLGVSGGRSIQAAGHVRLNQLTGHHQLLKVFKCRCAGLSNSHLQTSCSSMASLYSSHSGPVRLQCSNINCLSSSICAPLSCSHTNTSSSFRARLKARAASVAGPASPDVMGSSAAIMQAGSSLQQALEVDSSTPAGSAAATGAPASPSTSGRSAATKTMLARLSAVSNRSTSQQQQRPEAQQQPETSQPQPQQQQQQQDISAGFDPSALPIADRVKLLRSRIAARARTRPRLLKPEREIELRKQVLSTCAAAGVNGRAASYVLEHVEKYRLSGAPETLNAFLACYKQLVAAYTPQVVLQWLKRVPTAIRHADEVPGRLKQLQVLLSSNGQQQATLEDVLELTRRCPQVVGVDVALLASRATAICDLLGRPHHCACDIIVAAPALLGMSHSTLETKVKQLRVLAASHRYWANTYANSSTGSLAVLLTYSVGRYKRLQYVQEQGSHRPTAISTVLGYSDQVMLQKHPGYLAWCEQQEQQQQMHALQRRRKQLQDPQQQQEHAPEEELLGQHQKQQQQEQEPTGRLEQLQLVLYGLQQQQEQITQQESSALRNAAELVPQHDAGLRLSGSVV